MSGGLIGDAAVKSIGEGEDAAIFIQGIDAIPVHRHIDHFQISGIIPGRPDRRSRIAVIQYVQAIPAACHIERTALGRQCRAVDRIIKDARGHWCKGIADIYRPDLF